MYTEEQARRAIAQRQLNELDLKFNLMLHRVACEWVELYNLPYRISLDYFKRDNDIMSVPINPYYPLPGIPKEYVWHYDTDGGYSRAEWFSILSTPTGEIDDNGKPIMTLCIPDYIRQQQEEKARPCKQWDLNTAAGRQQWLYYFMVFIMPYADDIPHWKAFDMWGDTKHTEQELKERQRYYIDLINRCRERPELYRHDIQRKQLSDYDKYDISGCYMWRDRIGEPTPPDADNALEIMYKERSCCRDYESECNSRYGTAHRIKVIIERLEALQTTQTKQEV